MAGVIRAVGGIRAIAPGLGTGVRLDDVYVLFDRAIQADASAPLPLRDAVASAVAWLEAHKSRFAPAALTGCWRPHLPRLSITWHSPPTT